MTDVQLLGHFVADRDEASFRDLVVRHGPMVLRVCRRVLDDPHEVDDSFQATFLVLVRKAPTIQDPEALGNWLHGVARRVAMRARRNVARRRKHEKQRAEMSPQGHADDRPWDDVGHVVREELSRLPESYRAPLELCYLLGRSHEEAAGELGWPLGTLKVRLVRGRERLRERLDRRGALMGVVVPLWLSKVQTSAVHERLVGLTIEAMRLDCAGGLTTTDVRFGRASYLARQFLKSGSKAKWLWLLVVASASLVATQGVTLYGQARAAEAEEFAGLPARLMNVLNVECR